MCNLESVKKFYAKLKTKGLSERMGKSRNIAYLKFLKNKLLKKQRILDLACGYGRLTIPLAKEGYNIEGVDISLNLIRDARKFAKQEGIKIKFKMGNICDLPYRDNSFDAIICMWSSFNHLLTKKDQIKAIKEVYRVLDKNGLIIIDMPFYKEQKKGIHKDIINGLVNVLYYHDKDTLLELLKKVRINNYRLNVENFGERRRLVLYINK